MSKSSFIMYLPRLSMSISEIKLGANCNRIFLVVTELPRLNAVYDVVPREAIVVIAVQSAFYYCRVGLPGVML